MSTKTETPIPTTEEEVEEWLRESKLAAEHIHEEHQCIKDAIELGLASAKEINQHKEY